MGKKWVYLFTEGNADMRELLGGKGANLAEMTNIGLSGSTGVYYYHGSLYPVLRGMVERLMMRLWDRLTNISRRWNRLQARSLEIWRIHF